MGIHQNSTNSTDYRDDPKFQLIVGMRKSCYTENATHSKVVEEQYNADGAWCPRTFDGFACWDATPASASAVQTCPRFIIGFDEKRYVYKKCSENGTWLTNPSTNKPWTNYSTCVDVEDLDFRNNVNNIYVFGYAISTVALVMSIAIFLYFRTLQCTRIRIHVQLFLAMTLNNLFWIVWYRTVIISATVVQDNEEWCQVLHGFTTYFMVASYLWMFCEGLHLHLALVVVFVKDDVAMRWFLSVGWGLSILITGAYLTVRFFIPGATERCWIDHSDAYWVIIIPVGLSLLASFIFLINVVRVLLTKLHPAPIQHASVAAKKAVRATLILIPLFGLHFVLLPLRPLPESPWEKIYQIISSLLTGLQGLCVAILFCFTNHDVVVTIKAHIARLRRVNEGIPMTGVTGAESLVNTRENIV